MIRRVAAVQLVGALSALLIAAWFVYSYSFYVNRQLEEEDALLSSACIFLRDYSVYAFSLPFPIFIAGTVFVLRRMETSFCIACQLAWVLALALICLSLVWWQVPFIPMLGPLL